MSCEHEVRFTIKPTDDACRFHFDVRAYKDRIVAPDEYSGATEVTPSHIEQVLPTTDKLVRDDITIFPAPTEYLSTDHNGTFTPSEGKVGFYQVDVDVNPDLRPLSVSENGSYEPDGFDGYGNVSVNVLSIMDSLLEIVSVVTPAENVNSMEFPCNNIVTGKYIIVSNPPGTRDFASQQNYGETINVGSFSIRGKTGGSLSIVTDSTVFYLKNPSNTSDNDWWQSSASFGDNGIIFSPAQGRFPYLAGVTYYLLRVKGA